MSFWWLYLETESTTPSGKHIMNEKYDLIDFDTISDKWRDSKNPIGVYIHSPFCPSICKYCIYAGTILNNHQEYVNYYDDYLPKVIELYRPILETKCVSSWFFGGGTPSMMSADTLKKTLELLPNFKQSEGVKTFEIHPAYWTTELLDVLEEFNFDTGIICLQSFDRKTLIEQKRVPETLERIVELTNELRKRNLHVFVDLICFTDNENDRTDILKEDLYKLYTHIQPDEISVQTLYQSKHYTHNTIRSVIESKLLTSGEYLIEKNEMSPPSVERGRQFVQYDTNKYEELVNTHSSLKCFRLVNKHTKNVQHLTNFIHFMDPGYANRCLVDIMAIGSYNNRYTQTHSNVGHFNYFECNVDNSSVRFKLVKSSFYDDVRQILSVMESCGEPPPGFTLSFMNDYVIRGFVPTTLEFKFNNCTTKLAESLQEQINRYSQQVYEKAVGQQTHPVTFKKQL